MTTPNDKEKVLAVVYEGGGYDIYRQRDANGYWQYFTGGSTMIIDETEGEIWEEYLVKPYTDLATLFLNFGGIELLVGHPIEAHPDIRETLREIVEEVAHIYTDTPDNKVFIRNLEEWREVCDKGYTEDYSIYSKYWPGYKEFQQRKKTKHLQS